MSQPPEFKSSIPDHLLNSLDAKEKYMLDQISIMGQKSDWLVGETQAQSEQLRIIKAETKTTNGKIAAAIRDIADIQKNDAANVNLLVEVQKIVDIKQFLGKLLFNKWFWMGFGIFILGLVKIVTTPELLELVKKILGIN